MCVFMADHWDLNRRGRSLQTVVGRTAPPGGLLVNTRERFHQWIIFNVTHLHLLGCIWTAVMQQTARLAV